MSHFAYFKLNLTKSANELSLNVAEYPLKHNCYVQGHTTLQIVNYATGRKKYVENIYSC